MSGELVTGYLRLVPTVQGIQGATAKALAPATREGSIAGQQVGGVFGKGFRISAKKALGIGAAVLGGFAAKKFLDSSKDAFMELNAEVKGLQRAAGGSVKDVSELRGAIQLSGAEVPKASIGLKIFGKNLRTASADTKKSAAMQDLLGTSFLNSKGQVENFTTLLPRLSDKFAGMEDGPNKTALALKLFGRSGDALLPFLSKGSDGIAELEGQAKKLGITLDQSSQDDWVAYRTESRRADAAMQGLKVTIGGAVLPMFTRFSTFLTDQLIPVFADVIDWLKNSRTVKSFTDTVMGGVDTLQSSVNNLKDTLGTLDFNNIDGEKLGRTIATALGSGLEKLGDLGVKIYDQVSNVVGDVDWVGLGIELGPAAIGLVLGLAAGIIDGIDDPNLWKGIWDNLPTILMAALAVALAPTKLVGPLVKLLRRIPIAGRFLAWVVEALQSVGGRFKGYVAGFAKQFWETLTRGLSVPGGGLIARILGGLGSLFSRVMNWLGLIPTRLGLQGLRIADGLAKGVRRGIPALFRFWVGIPGRLIRGLGNLAARLSPKGAEFVAGLLRGARDRFTSVLRWFGGLPGRAKGAIKGEGKLLKGVGGAIVDGLKAGLVGSWHKVTDWLSSKISGLSKAAKKLLGINSPSKVFAEIGHGIPEGMAKGLIKGTPLVDGASRAMVASSVPDGVGVGTVAATRAAVPSAATASSAAADDYKRFHPDDLAALADLLDAHALVTTAGFVAADTGHSNQMGRHVR